MSEVVVQISADESLDTARLTNALDAFAKWSQESGYSADDQDAPDIMMMTESSGGEVRKKLVFQNRDHAARSSSSGEPSACAQGLPIRASQASEVLRLAMICTAACFVLGPFGFPI